MSDAYSFDSAAPSDAERRRLFLQRLKQAANPTPGQAASAPPAQRVPNVDPSAMPVAQAPAADGMLQAIRAANTAPAVAAPLDQSSPGLPAQQPTSQAGAPEPAGGGMLQALRDALHNKIDTFVDSQDGFDENGMASPSLRGVLNANRALASYVPGVGDLVAGAVDSAASKQTMKDALHGAVDTALDPATRARAARSVARGAQQGLSGFNEGLGNVVFAPADALDTATDYVAGKLASTFGTTLPAALPRAHDYYNGAFVAPAGQPENKIEQRIRGAARSFGTDAPALLLGGGLATAGARSGVTLAEQGAPGLLDTIRAPATRAADYITDGGKVTVRDAAGFLASKLREMVPNFINAMHPTNMANAVRASNLQGAADTALQRVAAHPRVTAFGDLAKDWRDEKKREAQP